MISAVPDAPSRLRYRFGFWAIGYTFLVLLAGSTAPSPLYVLYAHRDHFSPFMITLIYAAYAVGVLASLIFAAHLSDVQGRRPHLLAAVVLAMASGSLFIAWPALAGLFAARVLCGISVGLTMGTATAYLNELHQAHRPRSPGGRPQLMATVANLGGMSTGALVTGLLAQYVAHPLAVPYWVLLGALVIAAIMVAATPETRRRQRPLPPYRPQRMSAPEGARPAYLAALAGIFFAFAGPAVFVGLAGTFLAKVVHDRSLAMSGATIFVMFAVGIALAVAASRWPARRLLATGVILELAGLGLVAVAAWLPVPSLAVFISGGGALGGAAATLLKGTTSSLVAISPAGKLGETLAGYFVSGYIGLSVPVIGVGIALRSVSPRETLLAFAIAVAAGVIAASPILLTTRRPAAATAPQAAAPARAGNGPAAMPAAQGRRDGGQQPPAGLGARLARAYVERWENTGDDDPYTALARSAVSPEGNARLQRSALEEQHAPLHDLLGDSDEGRARIAMAQCLISGMIMERYIHALEPARSLPAADFEAALARLLQRAISG